MKYISRESFLFYNKTNFERFTSLVTDKREDTAQCFRRVSGRVWTSSWSWRSRPCLRCWWRASPAVRTAVKERLQVRSSHPSLQWQVCCRYCPPLLLLQNIENRSSDHFIDHYHPLLTLYWPHTDRTDISSLYPGIHQAYYSLIVK